MVTNRDPNETARSKLTDVEYKEILASAKNAEYLFDRTLK